MVVVYWQLVVVQHIVVYGGHGPVNKQVGGSFSSSRWALPQLPRAGQCPIRDLPSPVTSKQCKLNTNISLIKLLKADKYIANTNKSPSSWTMPHQRPPFTTNASGAQIYITDTKTDQITDTNNFIANTNKYPIKTSHNNGSMHNNSAFELKLIGHLEATSVGKHTCPK